MSEEVLFHKRRNVRLKLLRTVRFWREEWNRLEHEFFPPLAMGILFAQLKRNGYNVSQDDLSIRLHYDNFDKGTDKQFRHDLFFQEERIKRYVKSGTDDELESEIEKISRDVSIKDIDIFLLSIPESLHNSSNILFAIALSKLLKKKYAPQIVVGGHPFSVMLLINQYDVAGIIDYIVLEDGEEVIIDVVDRIIHEKDNKKSNEVKVIRKHSRKIVIPDFSGLPFDKYKLSFLDYNGFHSNEVLRDFFTSNTLILPFQFIKGCPNICAFCGSSAEGLKAILEPEEVVNGIKMLQGRFSPTGYLFLNDTINISKGYIEEICDLLCEKNINILWSDCATARGLDEGIIAKMQKAGCIRLVLGMETASSSLLERVDKGITLLELEDVLKLASKYGIWTGVEVICGLPHEKEDDINMTINFLLKNREYIDRIYCNVFDLRDNSRMIRQPGDYGIENIREINLYSVPGGHSFNRGNFVRYSFDETNGLKWEDKKKQIIESYFKVVRATDALASLPNFLEEHFLFYLYTRFNDKSTVKKYYLESIKYF